MFISFATQPAEFLNAYWKMYYQYIFISTITSKSTQAQVDNLILG